MFCRKKTIKFWFFEHQSWSFTILRLNQKKNLTIFFFSNFNNEVFWCCLVLKINIWLFINIIKIGLLKIQSRLISSLKLCYTLSTNYFNRHSLFLSNCPKVCCCAWQLDQKSWNCKQLCQNVAAKRCKMINLQLVTFLSCLRITDGQDLPSHINTD